MAVENYEQSKNYAESSFEWAREAMRQKKWALASERWNVLRKAFPEYAAVWVQGAIAQRKNQNLEMAEELLEQARLQFPNNENVFFELAEIEKLKGHYSQAKKYLYKVNHSNPNNILSWIKLAELLSLDGQLDEANAVNLEARTRFPKRSEPWVQYAELAMAKSDWAEALLRWKHVIEYFPDNKKGFLRAAVAAEKKGNVQEAIKYRLAGQYGQAILESDNLSTFEKREAEESNAKKLFDLVWVKSTFNLKSEASRNKLSYLWWFIEPLLFMAVFYVVFAILLDRGGENYVVNLLIGLVVFQWFAKSIQATSGSILGGRALLQQVNIAPIFFPAVSLTQTTIKHSLVFGMLFLLLGGLGFFPTFNWLYLVPVALVQFIFIAAVGVLLALLVPFIRDLGQIVPTGIQFLMFVSGIFFGSQDVPEQWREVFFLNPMANLIEQYRLVLVQGEVPNWDMLVDVLFVASVLLLIIGLLYTKNSREYAKVVSQ